MLVELGAVDVPKEASARKLIEAREKAFWAAALAPTTPSTPSSVDAKFLSTAARGLAAAADGAAVGCGTPARQRTHGHQCAIRRKEEVTTDIFARTNGKDLWRTRRLVGPNRPFPRSSGQDCLCAVSGRVDPAASSTQALSSETPESDKSRLDQEPVIATQQACKSRAQHLRPAWSAGRQLISRICPVS